MAMPKCFETWPGLLLDRSLWKTAIVRLLASVWGIDREINTRWNSSNIRRAAESSAASSIERGAHIAANRLALLYGGIKVLSLSLLQIPRHPVEGCMNIASDMRGRRQVCQSG